MYRNHANPKSKRINLFGDGFFFFFLCRDKCKSAKIVFSLSSACSCHRIIDEYDFGSMIMVGFYAVRPRGNEMKTKIESKGKKSGRVSCKLDAEFKSFSGIRIDPIRRSDADGKKIGCTRADKVRKRFRFGSFKVPFYAVKILCALSFTR